MTGTSRTRVGKALAVALTTATFAAGQPPIAGSLTAQQGPSSSSAAHGATGVSNAVVVSANRLASEIGSRVLQDGGNAVDAAIATGFALAVTHPTAGNIGGGGFMVIRFPDGRATALDFREKAPLAAHPGMFLDYLGQYSSDLHHNSHVSVGVPGTVAGFALAHELHGSRPWSTLVEPAVILARDGFQVSEALAQSLEGVLPRMQRYPASVRSFSRSGEPYRPGEVIRQADLAQTLERIMHSGRQGFYEGETARLIAEEMRHGGGLITEADLLRYEAKVREPLRGTYRGYEIISMSPPSSGGVALLEMLNILEGFDLAVMGHNSAAYIHHLAEAMRIAYRDRARYVADPDFAAVPVELLTSKAYAEKLRSTINPKVASVSEPTDIAEAGESLETTHFSVVDGSGMAVSVTYTLEAGYGSKIVVPGAGFLLNNEMGDFNAGPGLTDTHGLIGSKPNLARPEQRMLSSMTPTIVTRDDQLFAVLGSPGGRTIINTVLQVLLNVIDHGMDIQTAVAAPRFHHQWLPDRITVEAEGIGEDVAQALSERGHGVAVRGTQGRVHAILIDPGTGARIGAADPRDPDAGASGY